MAQRQKTSTEDDRPSSDSSSAFLNRRDILRTAGATGAAGAGLVFGTSTAAAENVDLGDEGLEEGDQIDPYLREHFVDGNEVHIPEGRYEWDGTSHSVANASLIGDDGGAVLDMGDGFDAEPDFVATGGEVRLENITQKGAIVGTSDHKNFGVGADSGARLILENVNRPDGQQGDGLSTGWYVHSSHAGEVVFRNCTVAGFGNNGIYGSGPGTDGGAGGRVVVEGGLFRNNNIASVRVGSANSVVRKATVLHDGPIPEVEGGGDNGRGIWVREGGEGIVVEDCDITFTADSDGSTNPLIIKPRDGGGGGTARNCRIWNELEEKPIYRDGGSWSGSGEHLTGGGNYQPTSGEEDWIECSGSDCDEPTREKQWVGGSRPSSGSGSGSGDGSQSEDDGSESEDDSSESDDDSSESNLAVETEDASDVTRDSATLNGSLNGLGGAESAEVYFEVRPTGGSWIASDPQSRDSTGRFSQPVRGLDGGTEYEYRALAETGDGDASGDIVTFTTRSDREHHLDINTFENSGLRYRFTVTGEVARGPESRDESNDSVTRNDDGTFTVEGTTGAGYSDDWTFDGDVTEWYSEKRSDAESNDYELVLDGEQVTPGELTTRPDREHHLDINTFENSGLRYRFAVTGRVTRGPESRDESNDSVTRNDDGTFTVEGTTGAGYSDDWSFDGDVTEWSSEKRSDAESNDYELVLDGEQVTPGELTS